MYALWWLDPFRIRRLPAVAGMLACLAALARAGAVIWPDEAWRGYFDDGYLSKFALLRGNRGFRLHQLTASWSPMPSPQES